MSKKERDKWNLMIKTWQMIKEDEFASEEAKQQADLDIATISGVLMSPLFPTGIIRNVLMFTFLGISVLAFYTPYEWLLWSVLIAGCFSPRIMGEVVFRLGRASARKEHND